MSRRRLDPPDGLDGAMRSPGSPPGGSQHRQRPLASGRPRPAGHGRVKGVVRRGGRPGGAGTGSGRPRPLPRRKAPTLLVTLGDLRAQAVLLLAQLGREGLAEVRRLEHLSDLDLGLLPFDVGIRAALDPLDGPRPATSPASSQKPATSSFVSANGPSTTVRFEPVNLIRAPLVLGCSPSPESMIPALTSSSLNLPMSSSSLRLGISPASEPFVALTMTMKRIARLLRSVVHQVVSSAHPGRPCLALPPRRTGGRRIDTGRGFSRSPGSRRRTQTGAYHAGLVEMAGRGARRAPPAPPR